MILPVEIKVNVDGDVQEALAALGEPRGGTRKRLIWFAEDRDGVADGRLPLLDGGVIVRLRSGDTPDELTVKLRPCTGEQLVGPFTCPFEEESFEYRIEEDLAGSRRTLAASATGTHPQAALLDAVAPGADTAAPLGVRQREFLRGCAPEVRIDGLVALGPIASTKGEDVPLDDVEADLERWAVGGLDFLEVSIRVKPKEDEEPDAFAERVARKQRKLESAVRDRGVLLSGNPESKTRRVLTALVPARP
ncbi:hypothetical protein [Streptomyces sp. BE303]|uniref:hypothetical protein n=1 Tax=Streptomyces sp. BE303 TaxID=3002528 RepID=UPI002E76BC92|nr:hypothetical protein [Streptomyces sp. BE303]MED7952825.1 hypothetical protein [Streptomyces sp. BE303]